MNVKVTYGSHGQQWLIYNIQDITHHVLITDCETNDRSLFGRSCWYHLELWKNNTVRFKSFYTRDKAERFAYLWLLFTQDCTE